MKLNLRRCVMRAEAHPYTTYLLGSRLVRNEISCNRLNFYYLGISHKLFLGVWVQVVIVVILTTVEFPTDLLDVGVIESGVHNFGTVRRHPNGVVTF